MEISAKHIAGHKQKELNKHVDKFDMQFEDILALIACGIRKKERKGYDAEVDGAFRKGNYLGCPGKDIYFALMFMDMDSEEMRDLAEATAAMYPATAPTNHVHTAACIRYIYGCFDKQGCLLSKKHQKMMAKEDADWSIPNRFMALLKREFKKQDNKYGLIILHEMRAHRFGDKACLKNDQRYLRLMMGHYLRSQKLAEEIKCWKQTFTPFYWAASYLERFDTKRAMRYHQKNLLMMEKYCPDARPGYSNKAIHSFLYLKKNMEKKVWKKFSQKAKKFRNKCLHKIKEQGVLNEKIS